MQNEEVAGFHTTRSFDFESIFEFVLIGSGLMLMKKYTVEDLGLKQPHACDDFNKVCFFFSQRINDLYRYGCV